MLLYHWSKEMFEIYFLHERGKKCWNIKECQSGINATKEHLLLAHAWSGCDTASTTFGKGKPRFLNLIKTSEEFQSVSELMNDFWANQQEIGEAAILALQIIYGGKRESMAKMRYNKYIDMICRGTLDPVKMPPSERAAYYHGLRVHLQVIDLKMLDDDQNLKPEEWGWKVENDCLIPIATDKAVASESLLKVIRCSCKNTSRNQCSTNLCTCAKHGL